MQKDDDEDSEDTNLKPKTKNSSEPSKLQRHGHSRENPELYRAASKSDQKNQEMKLCDKAKSADTLVEKWVPIEKY
jgi:hypothetical protein